jgi:Na+/proline symporter
MLFLLLCATLYTIVSGFSFVVEFNVLQLILFALTTLLVALFSLRIGIQESGGFANLLDRLPASAALFDLFRFDDATVFLLLLFGWWQKAPGNGLFVQRLVSARSEQDAVLSAFLYTVIHYVARAWPWYAIGALALIYFPHLGKGEQAFPAIVHQFLPSGMQHLVVLAFSLAFTSAVNSRLNWGASYFVNDVYGALSGNRYDRTGRRVERIFIVSIAVLAAWIALSGLFSSLAGIYKYITVVQAGRAMVTIGRWYWWRVTIWSEIATLASSIAIGNACALFFDLGSNHGFALAVTVNSLISGLISVAASFATSRKGPSASARAFNRRIRAGGPGWRLLEPGNQQASGGVSLFTLARCWLYSVILTYGLIVLIAGLIVSNTAMALGAAAATLTAACLLKRHWRQLTGSLRPL